VCGGSAAAPLVPIDDVPVSCNHLCPSRDAALSEPRAPISLGFCFDCEHIFNVEYDSAHLNYRPGYENSLRGSERFREYDEILIDSLVERYDLRGRTIIEIGCGRGEFLQALCERGNNSGIGFDPSHSTNENEVNQNSRIVIYPEVYGAQNIGSGAEFICSRHTLEHMGDPRGFLSHIGKAAARDGIPVFFEVPNGLYTLRDGGIWDIIYEHCSYFTPSSLSRLFHETGYEPLEVRETFGGQFLTIHARIGNSKSRLVTAPCVDFKTLVKSFRETYWSRVSEWRSRLSRLESQGRKVVLWGAGSKATTFLNVLRPVAIEYVVDVNPRKHGNYMIGTGQRIVPPEFLREYTPDEIICMNSNYLEEITCRVRALALEANVVPT
jgi:SAM-dependent methyltransferase